MSLYRIRCKRLVEIGIIISLLSPPFIGAYSWILIGGRSGILTRFLQETFHYDFPSIYGFGGILLVLTLKLYPFIYLYVTGALKKIDAALIEAAESLGCSGLRKVVTVFLPLITPTILAGALLVFMKKNKQLMLAIALALTAGGMPVTQAQTAADFQDAEYYASKGLDIINAADAYALGYTGKGITLGVSDEPVNFANPEFNLKKDSGRVNTTNMKGYAPGVYIWSDLGHEIYLLISPTNSHLKLVPYPYKEVVYDKAE